MISQSAKAKIIPALHSGCYREQECPGFSQQFPKFGGRTPPTLRGGPQAFDPELHDQARRPQATHVCAEWNPLEMDFWSSGKGHQGPQVGKNLVQKPICPARVLWILWTLVTHRSYNQGLISADRSNKATLLLTIPRCLLSRLQRISRAQFVKLPFSDRDYTLSVGPRHNRMVQAEAIDTRVIGLPLSFLAWILF